MGGLIRQEKFEAVFLKSVEMKILGNVTRLPSSTECPVMGFPAATGSLLRGRGRVYGRLARRTGEGCQGAVRARKGVILKVEHGM